MGTAPSNWLRSLPHVSGAPQCPLGLLCAAHAPGTGGGFKLGPENPRSHPLSVAPRALCQAQGFAPLPPLHRVGGTLVLGLLVLPMQDRPRPLGQSGGNARFRDSLSRWAPGLSMADPFPATAAI